MYVRHFGPEWNISTTIGWIAMKCATYIQGPYKMNSKDVGDPLTFPLVPPAGWSFHLFSEISTVYCHRI